MGSGTEQPRWAGAAEDAYGPGPVRDPGATNSANNGGAGPPAPPRRPGQPGDEANEASSAGAGAAGKTDAATTAINTGPGSAAGDGVPAREVDLASLLVGVERQRDEYLDSLRRLQAEFDNYRKRTERHQREGADNAAASLVKELLPVLDTADLALAHGGGEDVKHVAGALFDILSKQGLERIDPEGQPFDPEIHDAVAHEPADGDSAPAAPEVSEVMRAGYRWKGRVLRAAMVKVRG